MRSVIARSETLQDLIAGVEETIARHRGSWRERVVEIGLDVATDFRGAKLRDINLRGEDLTGFDFAGADLSGADLRDTGVTPEQLRGAKLSNAKLDSERLVVNSPRSATVVSQPVDRPRSAMFSLPRLSQPLSSDFGEDFARISAERRIALRNNRHFLLRGTGWFKNLDISIAKLHESPRRVDVLERMKDFGPEWAEFCDLWKNDSPPSLGRDLIAGYLIGNELQSKAWLERPEQRFLTYHRAVGLYAFFHLFLLDWFDDPKEKQKRGDEFGRLYGRQYGADFLHSHMEIEPIIYKVGRLSDDGMDELFGPKRNEVAPKFVEMLKNGVDLPWTQPHVRPERIIHELFLEDRCSDYAFVEQVSRLAQSFLGLPAPPRVRTGNTYRGPKEGIVIERFVDIRVKSGDY